ncbi:hypothetical protein J1N35_000070 [Gossypium stocksii]|uniref:P-type ATPase A domain-containing protein n=1 Tax=Gossypium stocksii TaxID=47602 RepID=A0A9D3WGF6_9ROSI|nr:hypothetical protein J1N35_000070 [Gossypium stocksii]
MLIPGDIISIKLGNIVLADARLLEGDPLKIDQPSLTGDKVFFGSTEKQWEIEVVVVATDVHTFFGKATHLFNSATNIGHFQNSIDPCHLRDDVKKRARDIIANFID